MNIEIGRSLTEPQEPRYTLAEARQKLNERECALHGCDWQHLTTFSGELIRIVCMSCGRSYSVVREMVDASEKGQEQEDHQSKHQNTDG